MSRTSSWAFAGLLCAVALAAAAPAAPNWEAVSEVGVVHVITQDEDGDTRDRKVWFVVLDGQGFIRTGGSRWGENLKRDPDLVLRIEDEAHELRADFIEDPELRARIIAAFREKYGWFDGFINIVRGSHPSIMHMISR